jgi:hypothetical protein
MTRSLAIKIKAEWIKAAINNLYLYKLKMNLMSMLYYCKDTSGN